MMSTAAEPLETQAASEPNAPEPVAPRRRFVGSPFAVFTAITATLLICFFFSPRFVIWRAIDYPMGWFNPEVNRAVDAWKKVEEPFKWIDTNNQPLNWRLLFPVVAHYLHFSRIAFLAIPLVGCVLTLGAVCAFAYRETKSRELAYLITLIAGSTSWFFASMGWLSYADSWYILGSLLYVFSRSMWGPGLTCLLIPWIDERFVLGLPLYYFLRLAYQGIHGPFSLRAAAKLAIVTTVVTVPYLAIRVWAIYSGWDPVGGRHLDSIAGAEWTTRLGIGLWEGLRGAWIMIAALLWFQTTKRGLVLGSFLWVTLFGCLFLSLRIVSGDHSRTVSLLIPAVVLGMFMWAQAAPKAIKKILFITMAFNLLAPAHHVIATFIVPIRYFYAEMDRYLEPPFFLTAEFYTQRGIVLFQQKNFAEATKEFDTALELNPKFNQARLNKAIILTLDKKYDEALVVLNEALVTDEDFPEAYYARGLCREAKEDYKGAVTDYKKAIDSDKKEWVFRADAERLYKKLRNVGILPYDT